MAITIKEIVHAIDQWAPFSTAEEWDNVGLLIGDSSAEVTKLMVALDVTTEVIAYAIHQGCNTLVCHHPLIFEPLKTLSAHSLPAIALKNGLHIIAAHTNIDIAPECMNEAIGKGLGISQLNPLLEDGNGRWGYLPTPTEAEILAKAINTLLRGAPVTLLKGRQPIKSVAICGGSGGSFIEEAMAKKIDAFITGEIKHNQALQAKEAGITVICAGHDGTELPFVDIMGRYLSEVFPKLPVEGYKASCLFCTISEENKN